MMPLWRRTTRDSETARCREIGGGFQMRRIDSRQDGRAIIDVTEIETEGVYHITETSGGCNKKMQAEEPNKA